MERIFRERLKTGTSRISDLAKDPRFNTNVLSKPEIKKNEWNDFRNRR